MVPLMPANPPPERLGLTAELSRNRPDRCPLRFVLATVLEYHPHRALPGLRRFRVRFLLIAPSSQSVEAVQAV